MTDEVNIATFLLVASNCTHKGISNQFCIDPSTIFIVFREVTTSISSSYKDQKFLSTNIYRYCACNGKKWAHWGLSVLCWCDRWLEIFVEGIYSWAVLRIQLLQRIHEHNFVLSYVFRSEIPVRRRVRFRVYWLTVLFLTDAISSAWLRTTQD